MRSANALVPIPLEARALRGHSYVDSLGGYTALAAASALPRGQLRELLVGGCTGNIEGFAMMSHFIPKTLLFKIFSGLASGLGPAKLDPFIANMHTALWVLTGVTVLGTLICLLRPSTSRGREMALGSAAD